VDGVGWGEVLSHKKRGDVTGVSHQKWGYNMTEPQKIRISSTKMVVQRLKKSESRSGYPMKLAGRGRTRLLVSKKWRDFENQHRALAPTLGS